MKLLTKALPEPPGDEGALLKMLRGVLMRVTFRRPLIIMALPLKRGGAQASPSFGTLLSILAYSEPNSLRSLRALLPCRDHKHA